MVRFHFTFHVALHFIVAKVLQRDSSQIRHRWKFRPLIRSGMRCLIESCRHTFPAVRSQSDTSDYISPSGRTADREATGEFWPQSGLNKVGAIKILSGGADKLADNAPMDTRALSLIPL